MSIKNLIKRIFSTVEANVVHGLDKLNDSEKRLNMAARKVSDEIRRLEEARLERNRTAAKFGRTANENTQEADRREKDLKEAISRGVEPSRPAALIILHRRRIAEALNQKVEEIRSGENKLNEAIIELGDKLDTIKGNLELVRIQKETHDLGLTLPEDIDYAVGLTTIDIDAMVREVEITDPSYNANSPSTIEADNYLASLKS